MIGHNGSSSSISAARAASRRLAGLGDTPPSLGPSGAPAYTRFRSAGVGQPDPPAPGSDTPTSRPPVMAPASFASWNEMLQWCVDSARAKTAFVTDSQGFVIAKQGVRSYEDAEAMGTQLMVALERFDEIDSFGKRALSIEVRFNSFWMCGVRIDSDIRERFTLGIVSAEGIPSDVLDAIATKVAASLAML
jgi:hypothetical protein